MPIGGGAAVDLSASRPFVDSVHPDSCRACQHLLGQGLVLSPAFQTCFLKESVCLFVCFSHVLVKDQSTTNSYMAEESDFI